MKSFKLWIKFIKKPTRMNRAAFYRHLNPGIERFNQGQPWYPPYQDDDDENYDEDYM